MFRCYSYTIIRQRINLCVLKLQLLKQSIKIQQCMVNSGGVAAYIGSVKNNNVSNTVIIEFSKLMSHIEICWTHP